MNKNIILDAKQKIALEKINRILSSLKIIKVMTITRGLHFLTIHLLNRMKIFEPVCKHNPVFLRIILIIAL